MLDNLGDTFVMEHRGMAEIKGKGNVDTFWLVGWNKEKEKEKKEKQGKKS